MSTRTGTSPVVEGLASGLVTFAWCAVHDVARSRGQHVALKVGLSAAIVGSVLLTGRARAADGAAADDGEHAGAPDGLTTVRALTSGPPVLTADGLGLERHAGPRSRRLVAARLGAMAAAVSLTALSEWGMYRFGEYLGTRGVRAPHTRVGVVLGLASGVLTGLTAEREPRGR